VEFPKLKEVNLVDISGCSNLSDLQFQVLIQTSGMPEISFPLLTNLDLESELSFSNNPNLIRIHLPSMNSQYGSQIRTSNNRPNLELVFQDKTEIR